MIVRPYQNIDNFYLPLVKIHFVSPDNIQLNLFEYSLLDTGASQTIIPYFLIDELFLLPLERRTIKIIEGVSGKSMVSIPYFLQFSFNYINYYDSVVYYIPEINLDKVIIGRNILNEFSVNFDGINKRIIIYP